MPVAAVLEDVAPAKPRSIAMGYGHAERNLALIRQLEAETRELLDTLDQLDPEQSAWLQENQPGKARVRQGRPET
jgi:hypothetical protein